MSASVFADIAIVGGNVRTCDPARPLAQALAIRAGRVIAVGDDAEIRTHVTAATEIVDVHGATVVPGLTDGHLHPVHGADVLDDVALGGAADLAEARARLAAAARGLPPDAWVLGFGLDPNLFERGAPTADDIEDAVGGRPAVLTMFDGHAVLASHAALARAGITGERRFDQGARIVCDADGRPTGHLLESAAADLVRDLVPQADPATRRDRLRRALTAMAATGLTGGHVMDADDGSLDLIASLEDAGDLPVRLRVASTCEPGPDDGRLRAILDQRRRGGRRWSVEAVKLFADGTIDGGTAWLAHPDRYGESTGPFWTDPAAYSAAVRFFAEAGVQTATHAIGDAAVAHVLDTVERLTPRNGVRHRIEHIETLPDDQVGRFARTGVVASMQPTHCTEYTRADHTDNWSVRLGDERADRAWRCGDLRAHGATVVLGSDWPIAHYDPRVIMAAAVLRRTPGRPDEQPNRPEQALTAQQALEGYTTQAAAVAGDAGRLAPGCRADVTVLDGDPLRTPADELPGVAVPLCLVDGQVTHRTG
ncbi:MAG TPA: amidohydrolase [Streptosporangiaceae bacterium]|jgi:hypothetical protein